jgi:hypothetical protein
VKPRKTVHGRYAEVVRELAALALQDANGRRATRALTAHRIVLGLTRETSPTWREPMEGP